MTGPRVAQRLTRATREVFTSFHADFTIVLCYHAVRRPERFLTHMATLATRGFSALSLCDFTEWVRGTKRLSGPGFLLTFDAISPDIVTHVLPILRTLKLPATFFAVSSGLESYGAEYGHLLCRLVDAGHTIGCHSHTHRHLPGLASTELEMEVLYSKQILENFVRHPITAFCYPYGAVDATVVSMVMRSGFEVAFTVDLGGVGRTDDAYRLRRVPILGEPSQRVFAAYLRGVPPVSGLLLAYCKVRERLLERAELREDTDVSA